MPTQIPFEGPVLGAALTVVGLIVSWLVWRRKGAAPGLRAVAWSLLPLAVGLMGLMTILWRLVADVIGFFASLVFNPIVWAGVALTGLAVVLWVAGGFMAARGIGVRAGAKRPTAAAGGAAEGAPQVAAPKAKPAAAPTSGADDDFDDIEALLRKRGID
ncbi:cellulose synthase [Nocardiopsis ansamitocini]|uniref:Cellulose synthase n=1 Tax=Nocardiopsis ansamitocini TaxID=1670832 RepID=A0A9W6UHH3_9ACTN|nr:cellulose synthase [Nocardiopsis ansamitocini]GLU48871.1 hypothetical protein Nans01_32220 [Nocardiopsis ansamitocini]